MRRYCWARTKNPESYPRCHQWPTRGRMRCRVHGGGKNKGGAGRTGTRDMRKAWAARKKYDALMHIMGLKHPGGGQFKTKTVVTMVEEAKALIVAGAHELEAALPDDTMTKEITELRPAEALGRAALSGSYQLIRIIEQELDFNDLKQQRLIGDMSAVALRLFVRAADGEYKARQTDALGELLAEIRAERATVVTPGGNK